MSFNLSISAFSELRAYLLIHLGLNFSDKHEKELIQKIAYAAEEFEFNDIPEFVQWLLDNDLTAQQLETLASYLTIGETYFLREKKTFEFLEQIFIPSLVQRKTKKDKNLRIWSAGCASGEEAYTIAISLLRTIPNIKNWNITILATDINPDLLKKAQNGIYSNWSFRNNPKWFVSNYFEKVDENQFMLIPEVKNMVTFASLNLAKDIYPSLVNNTNAMDIIFCRNVMIYFSKEGIKEVTDRFYKSLLPEGVLFVSPVEMSNLISPKFCKINYKGHTIYQKEVRKEFNIKTQVNQALQPLEIKKPTQPITNKEVEKSIVIDKPTVNIEIKKISKYEQAVILYEKGLFEQTDNLLSDLLTENKENQKPVISLLAKTKANLGKLNEARLLCEKGLEIDKSDCSLYYLAATIMQEQGNDDEAISSLKKAIYLDHNFALAHFLLGNINIKKGNNTTGKKHFTNALTILSSFNPEDIVPESDGLTVARFTEILTTLRT